MIKSGLLDQVWLHDQVPVELHAQVELHYPGGKI
jgi:hypothetical protein